MGEVMVRREEILLLAYESSKNKFTLDKKLPLKLILERGCVKRFSDNNLSIWNTRFF